MDTAILTNVQRGSLHDGPGVRTTFFFQGCNLHCTWCHNPETIPPEPVLMRYANRCIGCRICEDVCMNGLRKEDCTLCGACTEACPAEARVFSGTQRTAEELLDIALREQRFYGTDGGVTCSGGEPMLQIGFLERFLPMLKEHGIRTAVDTAGCIPWTQYERILPYTDLFLMDYKLADERKHKEYTGVSRTRIAENLRRFADCGREVWIRMPIIPGVNDTAEDVCAAGRELSDIGFRGTVELLPFHRLGQGKYDALGLNYRFADTQPPSKEHMEKLKHTLRSQFDTLNVK